jgi:hypothetical protein
MYAQRDEKPAPRRTIGCTLAAVVLWAVCGAVAGAVVLGLYGSVCGGVYGAVHGDLWKAASWGEGCGAAGAVTGLFMGLLLGFTEADAGWLFDRRLKERPRPPEAVPAALAGRSRFPDLGRESAPGLTRVNPERN